MTWRSFLIGLAAVAGLSLLSPYGAWIKSYGWLSTTSFPAGPVLVLVALTLLLNVLLRLIGRRWQLSRAELMVVWCMAIVGVTIPADGIGRFWYSAVAGGPYLARRPDLYWEEGGSLTHAPPGLVLSRNEYSKAAEQYFEGAAETGRVPWSAWLRPLLWWSAFFIVLYLAVFFLTAMLRRQWVERERLIFPLARVPLDFTEGSAGERLLPTIFYDRSFQLGLLVVAGYRLASALPLLFGADSAWTPTFPFADAFQGTPLEYAGFANVSLWPLAVGFAFLVPADVSLSVWFFFLFSRAQILIARSLALPEGAGTWAPLMSWQQAGAYIAFALGALYMARRHLLAVVRRAMGLRNAPDDSDEPVGYPLAFWGFLLAIAGCLAWYCYHGMKLLSAAAALALLFCWFLAYARMVAQGGMYVGRTIWSLDALIQGLSGGSALTPAGAVICRMQTYMLVRGGTVMLAPMAVNAFRISDVIERGRRWLLPAMMAAAVVAIVFCSYVNLTQAYGTGAVNFSDSWGQTTVPQNIFDGAHRIITTPYQTAQAYLRPLFIGLGGMGFLMFMRARFYWWPIHPIGLMACSSWHAQRLWIQFLIGWGIKVGVMKFAGGRALRKARTFFIAVIVMQAFVDGVSTLVSTISKGQVPGF